MSDGTLTTDEITDCCMRHKLGVKCATTRTSWPASGLLTRSENEICQGLYGPGDIPGHSKDNGSLTITFPTVAESVNITVLAFNFLDYKLVVDNNYGIDICGITLTSCKPEDRGKAVIRDGPRTAEILNQVVEFDAPTDLDLPVTYQVTETGFYCVVLVETPRGSDYEAEVKILNPYGALPAADYPKLPGYFEDYNRWGRLSPLLLVIVVILNAARNSISFFMLLIVALGYGVVRPTLGPTMQKCLYLTYAHFVFGVSYAAGSMMNSEMNGQVVLIFALPLSIAMTTFYFWILSALTATIAHLEARRQAVKLLMYKRLWRLLVFSVTALTIFLVVNTIMFAHREDEEWIPELWKWRWFLLDGWLNMLYLIIFVTICVLWRPTRNNQRYGLQELAQEDFEDEDEEGAVGGPIGAQQIKMRNVIGGKIDDEEDGEEGAGRGHGESQESLDDDDVLRWAEQNVEREGDLL
ncbi:hypothetical protein HDV00_008663 [Rhizophlyctis rosea]|nr:hypothetical protein HDV00_008663 [Rhizophlyctis rosea]